MILEGIDYKLDRDIPDSMWNHYMQRYKQDFKTFKGEDGIFRIKCKFGEIYPHSLIKGNLAFYGEFLTPKRKSYFLNYLPKHVEIIGEGETECTIKFPIGMVSEISNTLKAKKRIKLSETEKVRRSIQLLKNKQKQ